MFRFNHHHQGADFGARILRSLMTETCRSCCNVNFNILFKAILLCISW